MGTTVNDPATPPITTDTPLGETPATTTPPVVDPPDAPRPETQTPPPAAAPVVPDKYDLKLPDKSTVDTAVVERTAAKARELGLSNEHAQKTLDFVHQELAATSKAAVEAALQAHAPGGAEWEKNVLEWKADALADKELGGGDQARLDAAVAIANQVVAKFADKEAVDFFKSNPLGAHPALIRMLHRIGKASSEGSLIVASTHDTPRSAAEILYPKDQQTVQGSPD